MCSKILFIFNLLLLAGFLYMLATQNFFRKPEVFSGQAWTAKKFGDTYYLSVKNHAELSSAIADFVKTLDITAGEITGIGAVNMATLRFFNPETKQYVDKTFTGQMEISNLTGNISTQNSEKLIHLHITLGDKNYNALAGHLLAANISGAGEFVVNVVSGGKLEKTFDENVGLNFYDFSK